MAKDAELDRLKATQDRAFQRKQDAYQAQQRAWDKLSTARDAMNRAHEAKQRAYSDQNSSWQQYQSVRNANGPRIDSLNDQQERAFQNMKSAFDSASAAHDRRDGAGAASYAADGHRYKAESQGYVAERRRLVADIRSARAQHEATKPAFQRAKDDFNTCKRTFDSAKAEHERASAEFKRTKAECDSCAKTFRSRLEKVKAENSKAKSKRDKHREDKKSIAAKAGVPHQYRKNVWISTDSNGNTNIYFGGIGEPNGPGHGHYVMDRSGKVTYRRDPHDDHGVQNFEENRRESATRAMVQMAMNQWAKTQVTPRMTQFEDSEFKVTVRAGYDRRHDCIVTDVLIFDKHNKKEHYHLVMDEYGNEFISEWRDNH